MEYESRLNTKISLETKPKREKVSPKKNNLVKLKHKIDIIKETTTL